jgi:GNAT superfamily N-acetyltransferase
MSGPAKTYLRRTRRLDIIRALGSIIFHGDYLEYHSEVVWWLLWVDGDPAGFCGIRPTKTWPGSWYMPAAGLLPHARGRGLQRRMIRARVQYAKRHGGVDVVTYTLSNPPSVKNLVRCGFLPYVPSSHWAGSWAIYWIRTI